jgi:CDP-paratose 2-epimerase
MRTDARPRTPDGGRVLVTGGAGFVGTNLAARLLASGRRVTVFDNLSRPGVEQNLRWLSQAHGERLAVEVGDVRRPEALVSAMRGVSQVYHFAAQVAVTTSLDRPLVDFDTNARGTLNVLEAARAQPAPPSIVFTSTNKVYGACDDVDLVELPTRYAPRDAGVSEAGIDEARRLDFHSPYGCSKGAADQYVLDYARSYRLRSVVLRMSCIYGPHQFGNEDQGWIAHFLIRAIEGRPLTVYGDGKQVRDVLFVEDLVDAMLAVQASAEELAGRAFNVGGGPAHTVSLLELLELVRELHGRLPPLSFGDWRAGDQRHYVSDVRRLGRALGWRPTTPVREGTRALYRWLLAARAADHAKPRDPRATESERAAAALGRRASLGRP